MKSYTLRHALLSLEYHSSLLAVAITLLNTTVYDRWSENDPVNRNRDIKIVILAPGLEVRNI